MPRYILLLNWTEQGVKNAKDTVKRAKAVAQSFEKAGAKLVQAYWTLGQHDLVLIAKAPNDETLTALAIQAGMAGNVRTSTLRAFDEGEIEQILRKIPAT